MILGLGLTGCGSSGRGDGMATPNFANAADRELGPKLEAREADWRIGPIVYHVLVDRFAPASPDRLEGKRHLYAAPKTLHAWDELPTRGERTEDPGCYTHEIAFWGGDLISLKESLGHVQGLRADVLYLNPIHQAYTNHKYDAQDYAKVSEEYGTREDVKDLARVCHERGMKLMLDGVFNHVGRTSPMFQEAMRDEGSKYRSWFFFDGKYQHGYRAWYNVPNLPEVNLDNPDVRAWIWESRDSVVRGYLRDGVDGWRLDVAYDIGFAYLESLTNAAHEERPGSAVIGEIWNYPEQWMPSLDGVMNFHARQIVLDYLHGKLSGRRAGRLLDSMIADTGLENILRSWLVLDNHDTERLTNVLAEKELRRMARVLQFTLPGSPCVYYGTEVEMTGGADPENRAPMRWDLVNEENEDYQWFRKLVEVRKKSRALRVGEWRLLDCDTLMAFQRHTDRWNETVVVVANVTAMPVTEVVSVRDSKLMNFAPLVDQLSGREVNLQSGMIEVEVPAHTAMVLMPVDRAGSDYSPYKRVQ